MNFKNWLITESSLNFTMYHGTYSNFDQFDQKHTATNKDYGYYGYGIYLTPNPRYAKTYGPNVYKCHVVLNNPLLWEDGRKNLYRKYNITSNPVTDGSAAKELTQSMKNDGYDSIICKGASFTVISEICVFDSNQITIIDKQSDIDKEYSDFMSNRDKDHSYLMSKIKNPIS